MENEKRLIDANALKQMFDEREADDVEMYGDVHIIECFPVDDAKEIVDQMPTVDAVEVVRCRSCSYWDKAKSNKKGFLICPASGMEITADDFCSYGEMREGE